MNKWICLVALCWYVFHTNNPIAWCAEDNQGDKRPLVFVITGESNSGGNGDNSAASQKEREPRAGVRIMNLTSGKFGFEDMQLGVNNLRDHFRMNETHYVSWHGFDPVPIDEKISAD